MKIKKVRRIICLLMAVLMLFGSSYPAYAQASIKDGFSINYGSTFDTKLNGIYKYSLSKCESTGNIIYTGAFLTIPMYHTKGNGAQTNAGQLTEAISWSTTTSWNSSIGSNYGISSLVSIAAENGFGVSTGWSVSKSYAYSVSLSEASIKNATTGHYAIAAGKPHYRIRWIKTNWITGNEVGRNYFYMPYGSVSTYVVRSTNNQVTWRLY